jgi:ribonuclease M5
MLRIKETILVEGKYDRIKLSSIVDANIIESDGFAIFSDKGKIALLQALAKKNGLIILSDSDRAGFQIRNYVKNCIKEGVVKHAYIPDVVGKEKRKASPSKEGTLGVEGIREEILLRALQNAGISPEKADKNQRRIEVSDLYEDGLCGREGSHKRRTALLSNIDLPTRLSTKGLLSILNALYDYEQYKEMIVSLK